MARVTGHILTVDRDAGPVYYLKARDGTGRQIKHKLGPVADWPRKTAEDALRDWLTDLGRAPTPTHTGVTLGEAGAAWLRYVEHEKARRASTVRDYRNTQKALRSSQGCSSTPRTVPGAGRRTTDFPNIRSLRSSAICGARSLRRPSQLRQCRRPHGELLDELDGFRRLHGARRRQPGWSCPARWLRPWLHASAVAARSDRHRSGQAVIDPGDAGRAVLLRV